MKKVIYDRCIKKQEGVVLLWSMLAISLLILVVSFLTVIVLMEISQSRQIDRSSQAYMAAEAGYERAINYARNEQTTGGAKVDQCTDSKVEGGTYVCNVKYTFEVVKSAAGEVPANSYDANPHRHCDNSTSKVDYCFYAEGVSGDSIRKLDGTVSNIGPNQSKAVDFNTSDPVTLDKPIGKINLSPSGLGSAPPVPTNRNFYFYRGKISKITDVNGGKAVFGLGFTADGSTDYGIGAFLDTSGGSRTLSLTGVRITGASPYLTLPANTNPSISLGSEDEITFTLEYRRGASDISERTVSLQVNKVDKSCLGLVTASYTSLDPDYSVKSIDVLSTGVPYGFFNYGGTVSGFTDPEAPKRSKSSGSTDFDQLTVFDYDIPAAGYSNSEIYFKDLLFQIYE